VTEDPPTRSSSASRARAPRARRLRSRFFWTSLFWIAPWGLVAWGLGGFEALLPLAGAALTLLLVWKTSLERDIEKVGVPVLPGEAGDREKSAPLNGNASEWNALPEELGRSLVRLVQAHARMETILAAIHDGVVALDGRGRITLLNHRAREALGIPPGEWIGETLEAICTVPELVAFAHKTIATGNADERQIVHDGRTWHVYASPVESLTRLVIVVRDITEVRRLETLRRDFVANVSHELKTPLSSIQAYVDTLLDGALEDEDARHTFTERIARNVHRLSVLISDLLTISRVESGKAVTQRYMLDLRAVVDECAHAWESRAHEKEIEIEISQSTEDLRVLAEAEALRQVFNNLVGNAITYTESGGAVRVRTELANGEVLFRVEDTGIGIPKNDLPRVFERFYRVDKARSRNSGGTGLGLAIVKHYVETLHGRIQVDSELGRGSVFTVTFPLARDRKRR